MIAAVAGQLAQALALCAEHDRKRRPDVEVWDLPELTAGGRDPSIEKAVEMLLEALEGYEGDPETPTPPDYTEE